MSLVRYIVDGSNLAHNGQQTPRYGRLVAAARSLRNDLRDEVPDAEVTVCADFSLIAGLARDPLVADYKRACQKGEIVVGPPDVKGDRFILDLADSAISDHELVVVVSNDRYREFQDGYPWIVEPDRILRGTCLTVGSGYRWTWFWPTVESAGKPPISWKARLRLGLYAAMPSMVAINSGSVVQDADERIEDLPAVKAEVNKLVAPDFNSVAVPLDPVSPDHEEYLYNGDYIGDWDRRHQSVVPDDRRHQSTIPDDY